MILKKLNEIRNLQKDIDRKKSALAKWESISKEVKSSKITDNPKVCTGNSCATFEYIVLIIKDLKDDIDRISERLQLLRADIKPIIEDFEDPEEKTILRLRYLEGFSIREISKVIYMNKTTVH